MTYQQKKTLVSLICGIVLFLAYCFSVLPGLNTGENAGNLQHFAITILSFIGVAILLNIVIQIIFHILLSIGIAVNEKIKDSSLEDEKYDKLVNKKIKLEMVEDERDSLIELKALRVGYYFTGFGIITAIIAAALGENAVMMLNILFLSCMLGSIIEGAVQFYFYSRD